MGHFQWQRPERKRTRSGDKEDRRWRSERSGVRRSCINYALCRASSLRNASSCALFPWEEWGKVNWTYHTMGSNQEKVNHTVSHKGTRSISRTFPCKHTETSRLVTVSPYCWKRGVSGSEATASWSPQLQASTSSAKPVPGFKDSCVPSQYVRAPGRVSVVSLILNNFV